MNESNLRQAHILIVDDDETIVAIIKQSLYTEGFNNVHVAYDGDEALEQLKRFGADIVVVTLGLIMPKIKGLDVLRALGKSHKHIVGVIALTGAATVENASEFNRLGTENVIAFDFISKPFDWIELVARIKDGIVHVQSLRQLHS